MLDMLGLAKRPGLSHRVFHIDPHAMAVFHLAFTQVLHTLCDPHAMALFHLAFAQVLLTLCFTQIHMLSLAST